MDFFSNLNLWGGSEQGSTSKRDPEPSLFDDLASSASGLWDRFSNGVGDLGRGLGAEGFEGLKDLNGMMDRQQAARILGSPQPKTGAVAGAALEAPAVEGLGMPLAKAAAMGGAALEAPAEQALEGLQRKTGPVVGSALERGARHTMAPFARETTPVAPDLSPEQGWRKGQDGGWVPAGAGAAPVPKQYGLSDTKHFNEHDKYFQGGAQRTKYDTAEQRADHALKAEDGLLHRADGTRMDTSKAAAGLTVGSVAGSNLFVASGSNVYAADAIAENNASKAAHEADPRNVYEATHHSTFLSGAKVDGAGELAAHDGWLKMITNGSGHYMPDAKGSAQAVGALERMGVNTDAALVHHMTPEEDDGERHAYYNARAFGAAGGNTKLLDTHKEMFREIHGAAGRMANKAPGSAHHANTASEQKVVDDMGAMRKLDAENRPRLTDVSTASVTAEDQQANQSGFFSGTLSPMEKRGEAIGGWEAGSFDRDRVATVKKNITDAKLAKEAAAKAAAPPVQLPPAPAQQYLEPDAPAQQYLEPDAPAQQYLEPDAPAQQYLEPDASAADTLSAFLDATATKPETKAAKRAAKAAAKETKRQANIKARVEGDTLWQSDAPVNASRRDTLAGGWRRQNDSFLVPSPSHLEQTKAWRKDSDAGDVVPAEPVTSFKLDPHGYGHYKHEFTSYIPGGEARFDDPRIDRQVTKRFDESELAEREVFAEDGLLRRAHGGLMDTTRAGATKVKGSDSGRNIFALAGHDVVSASGKEHRQTLYASDVRRDFDKSVAAAGQSLAGGAESATVEHTHHSSFNGGGALDGAGDLKVKKGFVQRISNHSGHYEPDGRSNYQTLKALDKMGVNLDATTVDHMSGNGDNFVSEQLPGRALLESGNDIDRVRAQKGMFSQIAALGAGKDSILPSDLAPALRGALPVGPSPDRPKGFRTAPRFDAAPAPAPEAPEALSNFAD